MFVTLVTVVIITALMIGVNALYVAGEFATVSARKTRITQLANEGNSLAKMLLPVLEDSHRLDSYIAASQVGITVSSVVLGIYGQQQIAPLIEPLLSGLIGEAAATGLAATLVLILLTTLQVVLGELVPKSLALRHPEGMALWTAIPMRWSADFLLRPLIILLNGSGTLLIKAFGVHHAEGHKHVHSPEEIKYLIRQSHEGGLLDEEEHDLLDSALRFSKFRAGEIVIPRTRMVAADVTTPADDILRVAAQSDFTRIPIYEGDIDHIIGFIHLKELFRLSYKGETKDVRSILRDVAFVPETAYLDDVWNILNEKQAYLTIVLDEYSGTVGMITREDLLEELFGEVQDEFDESETAPLRKVGENTYRVRGDVSVAYLNDRFHLAIESEDAYTIGGFFLKQVGQIPKTGVEIILEHARLQAKVVTERAIQEILLTLIPPQPDDEAKT
ncbi:MAG: HlyC/CorC family transporter [Anaerolineaceae bacterium]|nr:HlyC/CorC family transporter [Anaerolineaceae bacterium]